MKLNADIVQTWLSKTCTADIAGPREGALTLERPMFLEQGTDCLRADHLYVCLPEHLPRRVSVERGSVIVCVGDSPRLRWFEERCCVIRVEGRLDLFHVFNLLQEIFNTFGAWETRLNGILAETGDVTSLLEVSIPIFEGQLQVLDANFHYLGIAKPEDERAIFDPDQNGNLSTASLTEYFGRNRNDMRKSGAIPIEVGDINSLSVNLLDGDRYCGSVTLLCRSREPRSCDGVLLTFLADYVMRAVQGLTVAGSGGSSIRTSLRDLVEGLPIGMKSREELDAVSRGRTFACTYLELPEGYLPVPRRFICSKIESLFARCWSFDHQQDTIVAIMDVSEQSGGTGLSEWLCETLRPIVETDDLRAGISEPFDELTNARTAFLEARAAIELGRERNPETCCHRFADHRLQELLANAPGDLPLASYQTPGLKALIEHDRDAPVSYVETLRCYLQHDRSATDASRALFVHRSTLTERLERIYALLGTRLDDPDERLLMELCLRMMEDETDQPASQGRSVHQNSSNPNHSVP